MTPRTRRGFTLVELAMAVSIGAVLMLGILQLLRGGLRMFTAQEEALESLQTATLLSEIVQRDVRYALLPVFEIPQGCASPSGDQLLPFKPDSWNQAQCRPSVGDQDVWDWGGPAGDNAAGGEALQPAFSFYRSKVTADGQGLFGIGSGDPTLQIQKVTYEAIASEKYKGPHKVFVLRRTVENMRMDQGGVMVVDGLVSQNVYKSLYFRRFVISLHESPENGVAPRGGPGPPPTITPGTLPPDTLFFARIMIAGVSVGRVRQLAVDGKRGSKKQPIDLMVNLFHLEGITDRFRARSLAIRWNAIPPLPPPPN